MNEVPQYAAQETTPEVAEEVVEVEVVEEIVEVIPGSTPSEVAQLLGGEESGWTGRRVRRYIRGGTFPATKHGGRWRMLDEQIEEGLVNLEAKATEKAAKEAAKVKAEAEAEAPTVTDPVQPVPSAESNEPF